jgi:hypothetical protein
MPHGLLALVRLNRRAIEELIMAWFNFQLYDFHVFI